jgi:hypothetical protein
MSPDRRYSMHWQPKAQAQTHLEQLNPSQTVHETGSRSRVRETGNSSQMAQRTCSVGDLMRWPDSPLSRGVAKIGADGLKPLNVILLAEPMFGRNLWSMPINVGLVDYNLADSHPGDS